MSWLTEQDGLLGLLPASLFCLLIALELRRPRRALAGNVGERWLGNVGLFAANAVLALWLLPALLAPVGATSPNGWLELLGGLLFLDLLSYGAHRLFHAVPALWRIHSVHHTDIDLDVTTAVRHHPLEFASIFLVTSLIAAAVGVAPGTIALYGALALALQMVQHGNVGIPEVFERLGRLVLVTPAFHRIHHSRAPDEHEVNFGTVLSVWDRLFGTARQAAAGGGDPLRFGVEGRDAPRYQQLHWMLLTPLV